MLFRRFFRLCVATCLVGGVILAGRASVFAGESPSGARIVAAPVTSIAVVEPVPENAAPVLKLPPAPALAANTGNVPVELPPPPPPDALPAPAPVSVPAAKDTPAVPAPTAATPAPAASATNCPEVKDYWSAVPVVMPFPRMGYFPIPPSGEGYYSVSDCLQGNWRKTPPKYPYPRFGLIPISFFDIDWRYLDKRNNTETDFFDDFKRMEIGDGLFLLTLGGDARYRYSFEENSRLLNTGPIANRGKDNHYDGIRVRTYADLMITDMFRVFVEGISATQTFNQLPPVVTDRDRIDLLNAFVEVRLCEGDCGASSAWLRVGRQELLYGSQRLVSTLEWVSTRRTFQGAKAFYRSEKWDVDAFCVQPVIPNNARFDSVDNNQVFAGLWNSYRPSKNQAIDAYYLFLDNTNPSTIQVPNANNTAGVARTLTGATTVHTAGARWAGNKDNWLWDVEGMIQAGGYYNQSLFARAFTAGAGYSFKDCPWTPVVWAYYDYASGTDTPGQGTNETFNQLFPFGHYYMGFIDVVGRRNINDINACVTFWPAKWLFGQIQVHNFYLDSARDALYNASGLPIRQDATGRSGRNVGTEFDFLVNFHLSNHSDVLISYSYLTAGEFLRKTATTASGRDNPQALYMQYSFRW